MIETQFYHLNSHTLSVIRASNEMDSTLLITGSTGTGKSHLAHQIYKASSRRLPGRWYKVNLATLSENLIESELFGHERGAFTGADTRRVGKLEACNGGTIFLDEIGELPLRLQSKLLDFIQYKKISPVGSNREIELDVRIIVATNRNLEVAVKAGEFRSDLFHRLNVFHIGMPDLSQNSQAVLQFAKIFLDNRASKMEKKVIAISAEVESVLSHYPWPGNLRELENLIEFSVAMETTDQLQLKSLPMSLCEFAKNHLNLDVDHAAINTKAASLDIASVLQLPITMDFHVSKDQFEKIYLEYVLKQCRGQINLTSRRIGLNKVSLTDKIKRHSIDWRKIRHESLGPSISRRAVHAAPMTAQAS